MPDLTRPSRVTFGQLRLAQLTLEVWAESGSRSWMEREGASVKAAAGHYLHLALRTQPPPRLRHVQTPGSGLYATDRTTQVAKIRG